MIIIPTTTLGLEIELSIPGRSFCLFSINIYVFEYVCACMCVFKVLYLIVKNAIADRGPILEIIPNI